MSNPLNERMKTKTKRSTHGTNRSANGTATANTQGDTAAELEKFVLDSEAVCDVHVRGFKRAFTHAARHCGCRVTRLRRDPKLGGNWVEATMSLNSSVKYQELGDAQQSVGAIFSQIGCMPITWCVEFGSTPRKVTLKMHLPGWVEV